MTRSMPKQTRRPVEREKKKKRYVSLVKKVLNKDAQRVHVDDP